MRIVGGRLRGRNIAAPKTQAIRPTSDRLRESVFNILAHAYGDPVTGARVLDLFAGTGALGIEAISRGAAFALFVDDGAEARALIRQNVDALGLGMVTRVFRRDATELGPAHPVEPFGLVFLDPPYRSRWLPAPALASRCATAAGDAGGRRWSWSKRSLIRTSRRREISPSSSGGPTTTRSSCSCGPRDSLAGSHAFFSGESMRAAVMQNNERPVYASFREPEATDGSLIVAVRAAALTGFDRVVARRVHYFKMPDGPFVLGKEGVAQTSDGRRIYFNVEAPVGPFGSMAERTLIDPRFTFAVPDIVADDTAAALGNAGLAAWLALTWRGRLQAGETVLILGATGVSGSIAVALAKRLGAGRVIAGGRNGAALQRATRASAPTRPSNSRAGTDLAAAYRDAAGGIVDLVLDFVCGAPAEAALDVLAIHGRVVLIGTSAGTGITVVGTPARRTCVDVMGFAYYHAPTEVQAKAYAELSRLAVAGDIPLEIATRPLADIGAAWDAPTTGDRRRQVLVPGA